MRNPGIRGVDMIARKQHVTLSDVAREVGVSRALVGKVLGSCSGNIRVSAETARMIREAAQRLHYQPNLSARVLSGQRSGLIGVLIDAQPPPVTFRTLAYIDQYATENGYRLLIGEAHDSIDSLYRHYTNFMQYNVDGVICMAHDYPGQEVKLRELFRNAENIVFVEKTILENVCCVEVDRVAAVEALTSLLLETRKRVGIVLENPVYRSVRQRQEGYHRALARAGRENEALTCYLSDEVASPDEQMGRVVEEFILPERLDAVIAPNDLAASHIVRNLLRRGIRIPEEVAVAGYDNDPFSESIYPSLTTIDDRNEEIGRHAVELLLELFSVKEPASRTIRVTPCVVRRESS